MRFDEQVRGEKRKSAGAAIETQATGILTPWREVVEFRTVLKKKKGLPAKGSGCPAPLPGKFFFKQQPYSA